MIISETKIEELEIFILSKRRQYLADLRVQELLINTLKRGKERKSMRQFLDSTLGKIRFANYLDLPHSLDVCKIFKQQGPEGLAKLILGIRYPGEIFWILSEDGETLERY